MCLYFPAKKSQTKKGVLRLFLKHPFIILKGDISILRTPVNQNLNPAQIQEFDLII